MEIRRFEHRWQIEARKEGRLTESPATRKSGDTYTRNRVDAALGASDRTEGRQLAQRIRRIARYPALIDTKFRRQVRTETAGCNRTC